MPDPTASPLDRARTKAYSRLLPLLFACYVIAYVDRANVAIAKLTMTRELPSFDNAVVGFGAGIFFVGYFLLEIPGTLLVEKWSARKWISRIMISWGLVAALTGFVQHRVPVVTDAAVALVHAGFSAVAAILRPLAWLGMRWAASTAASLSAPVEPSAAQFYAVRFLLGLAEAGFFPGVIVYLTHWFPHRDRARALAYFFVATPIAQIISPKLSNLLLKIGLDGNPKFLGLVGWQWVYIAWGIPAVILGVLVLVVLTDRPHQARWLEPDEREALELELKREKERRHGGRHMTLGEALKHPKVLLLAAAYFFIVTGNYGVEFFMPTILDKWYKLSLDKLTWLVILPPVGSLVGQLLVGWSSDRLGERRLHATVPIYLGAVALACTLLNRDALWLTVALFIIAMTGLKAYLPAFWSLPSLFLTEAAAAGSIGLINSVGNLGGFLGPYVLGAVETATGSFKGGILFLAASMAVSATIIMALGLGRRSPDAKPAHAVDPLEEAMIEPA